MRQVTLTNDWQLISDKRACYQLQQSTTVFLREEQNTPTEEFGFILKPFEIMTCDLKAGFKLYAKKLGYSPAVLTVRDY